MTYDEIKTALDAARFPVTYYQWEIGHVPPLPYVCYFFPRSNDDPADNSNYGRITAIAVELYTDNKDVAAEAQMEAALGAMGLVWEKSETYIDSERMYEVLYESEVCLNG